jgi:protein-tyrosine phosphatase
MRAVTGYSLWIGNRGDVRAPGQARKAGIDAIVDLAVEEAPLPFHREGVLLRVPLCDGGGNAKELLALAVVSVESLVRSGVPTLVVCSAGLSRSPAVAAWACSRVSGRSAGEVLAEIGRSGPTDVAPALWGEFARAMEGR